MGSSPDLAATRPIGTRTVMGSTMVSRSPLGPIRTIVTKGVPFNVEGFVQYNQTAYTGAGTGDWARIESPMLVQVWILQAGVMIPISDVVITGSYGYFKVTCTLGDNVKAGAGTLMITTTIHQAVLYLPVTWDEVSGNDLI